MSIFALVKIVVFMLSTVLLFNFHEHSEQIIKLRETFGIY